MAKTSPSPTRRTPKQLEAAARIRDGFARLPPARRAIAEFNTYALHHNVPRSLRSVILGYAAAPTWKRKRVLRLLQCFAGKMTNRQRARLIADVRRWVPDSVAQIEGSLRAAPVRQERAA